MADFASQDLTADQLDSLIEKAGGHDRILRILSGELEIQLLPASSAPTGGPFSTILKWRTYSPVEHDGEIYALKDVEFVQYVGLPRMTEQPLELAMAGSPPVAEIEAVGWRCRSGPEVSSSIERYRGYIQGSRGEWSVAKNCYVKTRSGWFGDRSASYLASGRPVALQSTGFTKSAPQAAQNSRLSWRWERRRIVGRVSAPPRTPPTRAPPLFG